MKPQDIEYNALLEALNDDFAIAIIDKHGRLIKTNRLFSELSEYSSEELAGQHISVICEDDKSASKCHQEYQDILEKVLSGEAVTKNIKRKTKNGSTIYLKVSYEPIKNSQSEVVKVLKLAQDITQQHQKDLDTKGKLDAINQSQAVIEFDLNGNVLHANENFLELMGYELIEIVGRHHSVFIMDDSKNTLDYAEFWDKLRSGEFVSGDFLRINRDKKIVWIHASYNPIYDVSGNVVKILEFAHDITDSKRLNDENNAKLQAIDKSVLTIEFSPTGIILDANKNFLTATGYQRAEVVGQHHQMFVSKEEALSQKYRVFWDKLRQGIFHSDEYTRYTKEGQKVWLRASYNPVLDFNGKIIKIVKYAQNVTNERISTSYFQEQITAIDKSIAIIEFNTSGIIINANQNFLELVDYKKSEIMGRHHSIFVESDYEGSADYQNFWKKLRSGEFDSGEYLRVAKNGRRVWIQASYNPIYDADGKISKIIKFAQDVTKQKLNSLYSSEQLNAINKTQGVVEFDLNGIILQSNSIFLKSMGYSEAEIIGKHHSIFVDDDYATSDEYEEFWQTLRAGKHLSGKYLRYGKNHEKVWIQAAYTPILDLDGLPIKIVKFAQDITGFESVVVDQVTNLYNREKLLIDLQQNETNNLALLELSNFHSFQSFYGNADATRLLKLFATRITDLIGTDFDLYRTSENSFAIMNHSLTKEQFVGYVKNLINSCEKGKAIKLNEIEVFPNLTSAVSFSKEPLKSSELTLKYLKKQNKSFEIYSKDLGIEKQFENNLVWFSKIKKALQEDRIQPFYQAIVNNKTGKTEKYESLVRLIEEDGTVISPFYFLGIAKESNQYSDITKRVINKSFAYFQNTDYEFSINLAIQDIFNDDVVDYLFTQMQTYGIADRLVIELVESEKIVSYEPVFEFITKLKQQGAKIAIDDFGSGYSNFEYIVQIQADYVKIDGSIVKNILHSESSMAVMKSILDFSQKLGFKTIAEFIADEALYQKVQELEVDYSQGFHLGMPVRSPLENQ
ncbi:PAS domain S-box protein [Thiomicrorhabdus indica]|uniref:PAS domain S-box protein n=1 Tax=Thiomicrorhabdus indica TaxID=2267253 RepID=UPI002AA8D88B|nr:PAS domain S-box protein [Thiomicrorhabdus indica]